MILQKDHETISLYDDMGEEPKYGNTHGMAHYFKIGNNMFHVTIAPKKGYFHIVQNYAKNLPWWMQDILDTQNGFSVFDFIMTEIMYIARNPKRSCGYALHIMKVIMSIHAYSLLCEKRHLPYHRKH